MTDRFDGQPRPRGRRLYRVVLVAAAAVAFLLLGAGPAAAHATLISTDPADGAVLPTSPTAVTLTFSEPVSVDDGVRLLDADGAELPATVAVTDNRVVITPDALGTGTVIVSWQVISVDSHAISGGFTFAVGEASSEVTAVPTIEQDGGVRVLAAAAQAIAYLGVLGAGGLIAFELLVLPRGGVDERVRGRHRRITGVLAIVGAAGAFLMLPVTELRQRFDTLGGLLDPSTWTTQLGKDPGLALALIVAGLLIAWEATRRSAGRTPVTAAVGLGGIGLALGAFALVGHTRAFGPVAVTLTTDLLHVTVAAFWLGGLVGLGVLLTQRTREDVARSAPRPPALVGAAGGRVTRPASAHRVGVSAVAVQRFSSIAAILVAVLTVAGVLLAWRILPSWNALFTTGYGIALLVKVGLAGVVVALAGYNRYRLVRSVTTTAAPTAAWRRLRGTVLVESGILVVVLAVTGWLVNSDPADDSQAAAASTAEQGSTVERGAIERTAPLGPATVTARITPGVTGVNSLEFRITDAGGNPLQPVDDPRVSVTLPAVGVGPLSRPVTSTGPGAYQAVLDLPLAGQWMLDISVRTSEFEQPTARIPVDLP